MAAPAINRQALIKQVQGTEKTLSAWLRRQVLDNDRIDVFAREVLGYQVQPFHFAMMSYQMKRKQTLQLAFRGSGKTTVLTVCRTLHHLVKDPNVRVLLVSKTAGLAQNILREVKNHITENEKFRQVFGDLFSEDKWDASEIQIKGKVKAHKEASVTCLGIGGQAVGKHFDVIICDDLVDEDNARTQYMRTQLMTWYYKVLHPTLEPHGSLHVIGTRYHFADLYGHLAENEMRDDTQVIPALNENDLSPWPDKYPSEWFVEKRKQLGSLIFNSQYQCDTECMKGEIFQVDWMHTVSASEVPSDAMGYAGIDLAIKESEQADKFAMVAIRVTKDGHIYIVNAYSGHLSFSKQTEKIIEWWEDGMGGTCPKDKLIRFGIETNAYQEAQYQKLKETSDEIVLKPIVTLKDKVTRGWKLAARFEEGRVHIVKGVHHEIVEHLVLFPSGRYRDMFDALDLAVTAAFSKRKRRSRGFEPGLI